MLSSLEEVIQKALKEEMPSGVSNEPRTLVQSMHMQLITERQTIKSLEQMIASLHSTIENLSALIKKLQSVQTDGTTTQPVEAGDVARETFLLILPCSLDDYALVVNTLNSLSAQTSLSWSLVVIADTPSPDPIFQTTDFLAWLQIDSVSDNQDLGQRDSRSGG